MGTDGADLGLHRPPFGVKGGIGNGARFPAPGIGMARSGQETGAAPGRPREGLERDLGSEVDLPPSTPPPTAAFPSDDETVDRVKAEIPSPSDGTMNRTGAGIPRRWNRSWGWDWNFHPPPSPHHPPKQRDHR